VGRDNFIYARVYIDAFNRRSNANPPAPESLARNLRRLQDGLQKRGKAFCFVIAPSKAEIYPEYIPPSFVAPSARCKAGYYQSLIAALHKEGVCTVDGHALFIEQKQREPWLLFPPGGIHWLPYGAATVVEQMTRELERQTGHPMVHLRCDAVAAGAPPTSGAEVDMALLLNTWRFPKWDVQVPYPRYQPCAEDGTRRPHLLIVGDSFAFGLIDLMHRHNVCDGLDLYYYFSTHYQYPGRSLTKLDKDNLDWERDIFSRDAVIIEANEVQLGSAAWGFIDRALTHLEARPGADAGKRSESHGP